MDTIANMLTSLKNANEKFKDSVDVPASKMKVEIARVLKEEGFIGSYKVLTEQNKGVLKINLKYSAQKERALQGVKRVSRPSLRVFRKYSDIPHVQNGMGVAILSTSQGLMTGHKAREKKVGGEILCYIW